MVALVTPLVQLGRWLDGSAATLGAPIPARDPLVSMDVIVTLVLYGVVLTVLANVAAVARHAAREGLPPFVTPAQLVELAATFLALMGGLAAWLFSEGTRDVAQAHWVVACGAATMLSVEMNTRVMLCFTARDGGLLSRALHVRALAFAAVPLAVRLGAAAALGVERRDLVAAALLAGSVAALLPCVHFIFAACTQVAAALGIATFSLEKPAPPQAAAAPADSSSSGGGRSEGGRASSRGSSTSGGGGGGGAGSSSVARRRGRAK